MTRYYLVLLIGVLGSVHAQTPVIGGACKLGTADVQIGGKQTQFFLKCEAASGSPEGEGVWVVKSRAAAAAPSAPAAAVPPTLAPVENTQPQQRPPSRKQSNPNICEQDNNAREADVCAVSATCLQANNEYPTTYLQCDQTNMRWVKKSCQEGFLFNFEQQTCIVPKRPANAMSRQQAAGLICTYSSCSNSNPCSSGTCNNGYCCSSGGSSSPIIVAQPATGGCVGCNQQAPQIIAVPAPSSCPGGGYAVGSCYSGNSCSSGYSCVSGSCCPSYSAPAPSISIYTCPSGGSAVGSCVSGQCATGYSCVRNQCCPSNNQPTNPFICPDGTQAVGGCVNGQCGTGYTCSNGLCCSGTTTTVRCLDGSEAVGACIPSCQGNACGGVQVTYYCGSGYTCTTGNICCPVISCPNGGDPIGPVINGNLCPSGYTASNGVCCPAALCADGSTPTTITAGATCPTGTELLTGSTTQCCPTAGGPTTLYGTCTTSTGVDVSIGPCDGCTNNLGYACDITGANCCPVVDFENITNQLGPGVAGMCPLGYALVYTDPAFPEGFCYDLQSIPGICAQAVQSGPCNAGACQTGYSCFTYADVCCPVTAFNRLRNTNKMIRPKMSSYGRPLNSFMAQMNDSPLEDDRKEAPADAKTSN